MNGHQHVDVVVSDYNSWADIATIDLEVLDETEAEVAHVVFIQDNTTEPGNYTFEELMGGILVQELSVFSYSTDPISIEDRTEMRVTFVITPITGHWLRVVASDSQGLVASAQIEFRNGVIGVMEDNESVIPPVGMMVIAMIGAVILVAVRARREVFGR